MIAVAIEAGENIFSKGKREMKGFIGNAEILKTKQGCLGPFTFMHSFSAVQIWIKTANMETFYDDMPYYRIKSPLWYLR